MCARVSGETAWRRVRQVVAGAAPAAGADWNIVVPSGRIWDLVSVYAQLVTAAGGAVRTVSLIVNDGTRDFLVVASPATQAAALTYNYSWYPSTSGYFTAPGQVISLPRLVLKSGWTIRTATAAIAGGDQWGAQSFYVVETLIKDGSVDLDLVPDLYVGVVNVLP